VGVAESGSWYDIPNSGSSSAYPVTIDPAKANIYYRLRHP
jgi:hypothetical protein